MTEAEWNACTDPQPMLEFLRSLASDRKLMLFAVACCRRARRWMLQARSRNALNVSELYVDGRAGPAKLSCVMSKARAAHRAVQRSGRSQSEVSAAQVVLMLGSRSLPDAARTIAATLAQVDDTEFESGHQTELLRDILGPTPFRQVTSDPDWLASTVVNLAQAIYQGRAFDRLPILADVLEDTGCHDAVILDHCRGPGPHVRGCWVVDLLTGRQ